MSSRRHALRSLLKACRTAVEQGAFGFIDEAPLLEHLDH